MLLTLLLVCVCLCILQESVSEAHLGFMMATSMMIMGLRGSASGSPLRIDGKT